MGIKNKNRINSSIQENENKKKKQKSLKEEHQRELSQKQSLQDRPQKHQNREKIKEKDGKKEMARVSKANLSKSSENVVDGNHILIHKSGKKEEKNAPNILIEDEDSSLLESVLWPLSPRQFFDQVWKKKAYASVVEGESSRMNDLIQNHLHGLNLEKLLKTTASESIFVWMRTLEAILGEEQKGKIESFELEGDNSVSSAKTCYASGASLYFRSSQELADILVARLTDELGIGFAGFYPNGDVKGEIEVFMSRKGHVTDWHFDFMENFTFQLKGKKTWKMRKSSINHPLRGATSHYKNVDTSEQQLKIHHLKDPNFSLLPKDDDEYETVTLTEGSFFYHPAGIWHRVECEEDSISINVSLIASSWADLVTEGIRHYLWTQDEWREGINFRNPKDAKERLGKLLSNLSSQLDFKVSDFLPDGLFQANGRKSEDVIEVADVKVKESPLANINVEDSNKVTFRRNPIAVLIPLLDVEEEVENEEEDEHLEGEEVWEELEGDSEDSNNEEGEEEGEEEAGDDRPLSLYALHVNFGNEELASSVEVRISVYSELDGAIDWLRTRKNTFTLNQLFGIAKKRSIKERELTFRKPNFPIHSQANGNPSLSWIC